MKLAILIPTLPERYDSFRRLKNELMFQVMGAEYQWVADISVLADHTPRGHATIGEKRNFLLKSTGADYVAFFDDDDWPEPNYISSIMQGIELGVDCCSLRGIITTDGKNPEIFEHSIRYKEWRTTENAIKYERYPNHLNAIRSDIAKQFRFPESNHGEDHDWSTQVFNSGLIKKEHYIEHPIYQYRYVSNK